MQPQQPQAPKNNDKTWILTGAIAYVVLSVIFAGFIVFESVECFDTGNSSGTEECIEDVESKAAPYEALFSLVQIVGIVAVIVLLVRHNNRRREMYGQQPPLPPSQPTQTPHEEQSDDDTDRTQEN